MHDAPALDRRLFDGKVTSSVIYPGFFPMEKTDEVVNLGCGLAPQAVVYAGRFRRMVGVDLHEGRLKDSHTLLAECGVSGYETRCAPVENTGLPSNAFDKALAIDIIEHVPDPAAFLREAHRLLKPGGTMLVSVPAMHDHYVHAARAIGRLLARKTTPLPHGHLDAHNSTHSVSGWLRLVRATPFTIVRTRATTLWPPLHLYGVPRFWFTNPVIRAMDDILCVIPGLKRLGQAYLLVLRKPLA
ncbi:MAG: ArsR family transcriptional regulator [Candidatus Peregrinibacteria bacterium Gr01-1014_25]|nr:MAG: ArsR family transcriptional regulator [Candidatus Peregrinibacteria bacterium Gr01-1014_25]